MQVHAERAAWKFVDENPELGFRVSSVAFSMAFGPQQNSRVTSSNEMVRHLLLGELPFLIPYCLEELVDVRDVARAHVHTLLQPEASGRSVV